MIAPCGPPRRSGNLVWLTLLLTACGEATVSRFDIAGHRYDSDHVTHVGLPKALREVSGLTSAGPGRVYAHNDERAEVVEVDYLAPGIRPAVTVDDGLQDDFEGIATLGERLFLVTSRGILYESRIGVADGAAFTRHADGLDCEVEGLTAAPGGDGLLAVCKNLPDDRKEIVVHTWDVARQRYDVAPPLSIPLSTVTGFLTEHFPGTRPPKRIQPTGITITPQGNLLLVAARQHLLLEFTLEGIPVAAAVLDPAVHRQAEGIEIDTDGRLLVASEGDSKGDNKTPGVLSVYEPVD